MLGCILVCMLLAGMLLGTDCLQAWLLLPCSLAYVLLHPQCLITKCAALLACCVGVLFNNPAVLDNPGTLDSSGSSTTTTRSSMTRRMSLRPPLAASDLRRGRTRTATIREELDVEGTYCKQNRMQPKSRVCCPHCCLCWRVAHYSLCDLEGAHPMHLCLDGCN
jgi:hypothetical protein